MKAVAAILLLALVAYARADAVANAIATAEGDGAKADAKAVAIEGGDKYVAPGFYEYSGYEDYDPSYKFGFGFKRVKAFDPSYYSLFSGRKCGLDKYYSCKDGHCGDPVCKTAWKPCGGKACSFGEECVEFKDGYKCVEYECKKDGLKCYIGAKKFCKEETVCYDDDCKEEKVLVCEGRGRKLRAEANAVAEAIGDDASADAAAKAVGEDAVANADALAIGDGAKASAEAIAIDGGFEVEGGRRFKHGGFNGKGGYDYYYEEPYYADPKCYYKIVKKCKERCEDVEKCIFKVGEVCEKDPDACKKEPVACGDGYCKPGDYCEKPDCYSKDKCFFYDKFHCW